MSSNSILRCQVFSTFQFLASQNKVLRFTCFRAFILMHVCKHSSYTCNYVLEVFAIKNERNVS